MAEITIIPESIQLVKMSDTEYFSSDFSAYLSNSKIGLLNPLEGGSIEKFLSGFEGDYSDSYELGSAVHCMTLQENSFFISNIRKPSGKLGVFAENVFLYRKNGATIKSAIELASKKANYYATSLSNNRLKTAIKKSISFYRKKIRIVEDVSEKAPIYLSDAMFDKYVNCMTAVVGNSKIQKLLKPEGLFSIPEVYNELAILCELEFMTDEGEFIVIPFKAKLDNFTIDHETKVITLNDLKTTGKPVKYFMGNKVHSEEGEVWYNGSFQKYRYYRQMSVYLWLLQAAIKQLYPSLSDYSFKANMLVVETIPEFGADVFKIGGKSIKAGLEEFKTLLTYYAEWKKFQ